MNDSLRLGGVQIAGRQVKDTKRVASRLGTQQIDRGIEEPVSGTFEYLEVGTSLNGGKTTHESNIICIENRGNGS